MVGQLSLKLMWLTSATMLQQTPAPDPWHSVLVLRPFSWQTFWLVTAGGDQVELTVQIYLCPMKTYYWALIHNSRRLKLAKLNRLQPLLMLLITPVLLLLWHVKMSLMKKVYFVSTPLSEATVSSGDIYGMMVNPKAKGNSKLHQWCAYLKFANINQTK